MATIICESCGKVDIISEGSNYYFVKNNIKMFKDEYANTHILCSNCVPKTFKDGRNNVLANLSIFDKRHWSEYGDMNKILEVSKLDSGKFINAKDYFKEELK